MRSEPLGEQRTQLLPGARLGERLGRESQDRAQIDVAERRSELAVARELGVEHRLHERAQPEAVIGRDEMDRPAHDDDARDPALDEEVGERLRAEVGEARPEAGVRIVRNLRLEPDEVVDHRERRHRRAVEEVLAGKGRAVELAGGQAFRAHEPILRTGALPLFDLHCGWP